MLLFHQDLGKGTPMMILHGLLGSSDNWRTHSLKLAEKFRVLAVDLRNHGHSFHSSEHTYDLMVEDIYALFSHLRLDSIILVGHSMGGKAAMFFALQYPELVKKLVVADMAPRKYPPHHNIVLEALNAVDMNIITSRKEAEEILTGYISESSTRQFLLKGLVRNDDGSFRWRFNLKTLTEEYDRINIAVPAGMTYEGPALFITGEESNYVLSDDRNDILKIFPNTEFSVVEGAGHWLHADRPDDFLRILINFSA